MELQIMVRDAHPTNEKYFCRAGTARHKFLLTFQQMAGNARPKS
jgi:hypothetical protein